MSLLNLFGGWTTAKKGAWPEQPGATDDPNVSEHVVQDGSVSSTRSSVSGAGLRQRSTGSESSPLLPQGDEVRITVDDIVPPRNEGCEQKLASEKSQHKFFLCAQIVGQFLLGVMALTTTLAELPFVWLGLMAVWGVGVLARVVRDCWHGELQGAKFYGKLWSQVALRLSPIGIVWDAMQLLRLSRQ